MILFVVTSLVLHGIVLYNGNRSRRFGIWDLGIAYCVFGIEGSLSLACSALIFFVAWLVGLELGWNLGGLKRSGNS